MRRLFLIWMQRVYSKMQLQTAMTMMSNLLLGILSQATLNQRPRPPGLSPLPRPPDPPLLRFHRNQLPRLPPLLNRRPPLPLAAVVLPLPPLPLPLGAAAAALHQILLLYWVTSGARGWAN